MSHFKIEVQVKPSSPDELRQGPFTSGIVMEGSLDTAISQLRDFLTGETTMPNDKIESITITPGATSFLPEEDPS